MDNIVYIVENLSVITLLTGPISLDFVQRVFDLEKH